MSKIVPINMRVEPEQCELLTKAATILHMDRSAFILSTACKKVENVLLNQRLFYLNEDDFDAFNAQLDEPIINNKLKELLLDSSL